MEYQGFIKNSKRIWSYEKLSIFGKLRFWLKMPRFYIKRTYYLLGWKLFIDWKIQRWLKK